MLSAVTETPQTAFYANAGFTAGQQKHIAAFEAFRDSLVHAFQTLENDFAGVYGKKSEFIFTPWNYHGNGGGVSALIRGGMFEKAGVNISAVSGTFPPEFAKNIPGAEENNGAFFATGVSVVAHMRNPHAPAAHMNVRRIETAKGWYGGGGDLTPALPKAEETAAFRNAFRDCCNRHDPSYYETFSKQCDEYFFLPHRNETRGVGGIFYDYLDSGSQENDFAFTLDVAETFKNAYCAILEDAAEKTWTEEDRAALLQKRGRYAEFNLLYDRGTKFGLATGGNTESILMSLPPEATW